MKKFFTLFNRSQHQPAAHATHQWRFGWSRQDAEAHIASTKPRSIGMYGGLLADDRSNRSHSR